MALTERLRKLPRHTLPLMIVTWIWQAIAFYLPKVLMNGKTHHDLSVAADALIPFAPISVIVYLAAFVTWPVCYLYCAAQEKERAYRFLCAEFLAKLICFLCFLLLPTAIVRPEVTDTTLCEMLVRFVYWFDSPTNLFPSIHCLMSWLIYLGVRDTPNAPRGAKTGLLAFALAVCVSTLTMKQHFIVDVFAGVAVAELCYRLAQTQSVMRVYAKAADRITSLAVPNRETGAKGKKTVQAVVRGNERILQIPDP